MEVGNAPSKMHRYLCDGMPTLMGCNGETEVSVQFVREGVKKSGWLVTPPTDFDGTPDRDAELLTFCPRCAAVVQAQAAAALRADEG